MPFKNLIPAGDENNPSVVLESPQWAFSFFTVWTKAVVLPLGGKTAAFGVLGAVVPVRISHH